jgi:hypothetical protein
MDVLSDGTRLRARRRRAASPAQKPSPVWRHRRVYDGGLHEGARLHRAARDGPETTPPGQESSPPDEH